MLPRLDAEPMVLGVIAGDRTRNLMYRVTMGELPQVKPPRLAVVLIGGNDLASAHFANPDGGEQEVLDEVVPTFKR